MVWDWNCEACQEQTQQADRPHENRAQLRAQTPLGDSLPERFKFVDRQALFTRLKIAV
jgi:hypothetical protein